MAKEKKEKKEKAPKAAKAPKAKKKTQFSSEKGGIGKVFQQHGEKIGFAIVIAASLALVYLGWTASTTLAPDTSKLSPAKIRDLAKNASSNIQRTEATVVVPPAAAIGIVGPIDPVGLTVIDQNLPGVKPTPRSTKLRKDPELFAPIKPEVIAVTAALSQRKENPDRKDPLSLLPDWKEKGGPSNEAAGGGGLGGAPGGPPGGIGGPPGGRAGGPPGGIGGPGGMGGQGGMGNSVASSQDGHLNDGFIPTSGEAYEPVTKSVIVVRMLVPNDRQMQEYKDKFDGTDEPTLPNILGFQVQRVEVSGPNDKSDKWVTVDSSMDLDSDRLVKDYGWEGVGPIVADASVYHQNLTMPMPPIIGRKFTEISLHSETPAGQSILAEPEKPKDEETPAEKKRARGEFEIDPTGSSGALAGGRSGSNPYAGGRGMGAPGMGAPGLGAPGAPGMGRGMSRPGGGDGDEGLGASMGGGGFNPYGGMTSSGSANSKYYLLRYCDVDVEPGKQYRYRVRVIYEDPNKPIFETYGTRPSAMDNSVLERQHKEAQEAAKAGKKHQPNLRFTDWSEPTPIAKVSDGNYAYTGGSGKGYSSVQRIPGVRIKFFGNEPTVQMLPVVYDTLFGVDVYPPEPVEAQRGAVLDMDAGIGTQKKKVIHPVTRVAKEMEIYPSNTGITVVDMLGGETIANRTTDTEALLAPLDVMVVDQSGHVVVRNDMKDDEDFHKFVAREAPKNRQGAAAGGFGSPPGGIGGPAGGDGGEGSGRPAGKR